MNYRTLDLHELADELADLQDIINTHDEDKSKPTLTDDEQARYDDISNLQQQLHNDLYIEANHGEFLIAEEDFKEYAMCCAEETGAKISTWPYNCIDWDRAADELLPDYSSYEFDGQTWLRND
jgi:hypothetical protein